MSKLTIIVPAYNEQKTILRVIKKLQNLAVEKQIIIVDDASSDGTAEIIRRDIPTDNITKVFHSANQGKGAAIQSARKEIRGDYVVIQDADLEYDPEDFPVILGPLLDGRADVVYGSRFLGGPHRVLLFWHYAANKFFTLLTNILYNVNLTDMGVCYKAFSTNLLRSIRLRSNRFGFEPEVTAKICKRHARIYEVPISYSGRTYADGKKITWKDAFSYLWCLLRYRIAD